MKKRITENKTKSVRNAVLLIAGVIVIAGIRKFSGQVNEKIIGIIPRYDSVEFQCICKGFKEEAERQGYQLSMLVPEEMTVQAQRTAMKELVSEGAECILVEAAAEGGFQDMLDECVDRDVSVLAYNSRINSADIYSEVLPYSVESAAETMLSVMSEGATGSGQFGVLSDTSQDYLQEAKTREMLTKLETGTYPELCFTGSGFVKEQKEIVLEKAEQIKTKYPDLEYLICYSTLETQAISEYIAQNRSEWKLICEGVPDELDESIPEGAVILTYDYHKYGRFMAKLAIESIKSNHIPVTGDIFEWDNGERVFIKKWEMNSSESNTEAGTADFCAIIMQESPKVLKWENGEWK